MQLPPELQSLICQDLTEAELKSTRFICKSFDQAAVPFLFEGIFVAARYSDLDNADLIVSRFGSYVRILTLSFVEYEPLSLEDYRRKVEQHIRNVERFNGHLEHAFELYCKAQTESLEIYRSGEFMARLCLILSKSPNIRKMILTDCGNDDSYHVSQLHPHDPWKQDDLCPFKVCTLSVADHIDFHVRPGPPYQMTPNPFHQAMLAISAAKSNITELAMIHDGVEDDSYPREAYISEESFVMTARQSCCLTLQLQNLTKLRMRVSSDNRRDRIIAKALSVAVNLESLFFASNVDDSGPDYLTTMSRFFHGCKFPKLKSLIMKCMGSTEDELVDFMKGSPSLKHLALQRFNLKPGSWESVARIIRPALRLKSVMLHEISRSDPGSSYNGELDWSNDHRLIEDFFLREGENPFTEAAIESWLTSSFRTRKEINKDLDCEGCYHMFH